ncbi:MAG: hypothetical protein IJX25_00970 [Clostridia bacterium]|nr:hypothetical protein [Clostridia bacterium]
MADKGIISYGQHYLENTEIQDILVGSAKLSKKDVVIEIGAGDGRITEKLSRQAGKVVAYEIDQKTKIQLKKLQEKCGNVEIRFENFLTASLPQANKIVASLPYQITEPFLEKIKLLKQFERFTLLVGKNFGQMADENEDIKISKLYLLFRCYFHGEYILDVGKENFVPPPNTISSIINIWHKGKEELLQEPELYIMREIFEQRDKKVTNALREAFIRFYSHKGDLLTKRGAKQLLQDNFDQGLTDNYLEQMNNQQIETLFNCICKIIKN